MEPGPSSHLQPSMLPDSGNRPKPPCVPGVLLLRWLFLKLQWVWASHCGGFSRCGAQTLGAQASVVEAHRLSSYLIGDPRVHGLQSLWAQLPNGVWDLPRPGNKPVSPALAGRFITTGPPGKTLCFYSLG